MRSISFRKERKKYAATGAGGFADFRRNATFWVQYQC